MNNWMCQNCFQLNKEKAEVIVFGNKDERLKVGTELQSLMNPDLNLYNHIKTVTESASYHLKNTSRSRGGLWKRFHAFIFSGLSTVMVCLRVCVKRSYSWCRTLQLESSLPGKWITSVWIALLLKRAVQIKLPCLNDFNTCVEPQFWQHLGAH